MAAGVMVADMAVVDMAVVTMASDMVAAGISEATVMAISVDTMGVGSSPYRVRFQEAVFAAIAALPGAVARTSARSETPKYGLETYGRETSATR
jgi:hypothetical protein